MQFHSFEYIVFLLVVIFVYFSSPYRFRWIVLLASSYFFYGTWRVDFLSLLVISTITDYFAGIRIEETQDPVIRKLILWVSLTVNLGLLFVFKYTGALWELIWKLLALGGAAPVPFTPIDIILPLGISFYTFQTLSYTIDVYRGRIQAERHFGYFALYVAFFPQLLAGPIERASHLLTELRTPKEFDWAWCGPAFFLIVIGLAKKLVIADRLGTLLDPIIDNPESFSPLEVLLTPPATVYQYYCDLSGYADIAIGSAMLLGIQLSKNFDRPFSSTTTTRFWYRWHITVTGWFRDYLLRSFTKGGSVTAARPGPLVLTGLLIGLWHSPTLGWLLAGGSVSLFGLLEIAWTRWRIRHGMRPKNAVQRFLWGWFGRLYVLGIVFYLIGLPLTWGDMDMLSRVVSYIFTIAPENIALPDSKWFIVVLFSIIILEIWQWMEAKGYASKLINSLTLEVRWLAATMLSLYVFVLADLSRSGFLYFKF